MNKQFHYSSKVIPFEKERKYILCNGLIHLFTQTTLLLLFFVIYISKGATMKVTFQMEDLCRALEKSTTRSTDKSHQTQIMASLFQLKTQSRISS